MANVKTTNARIHLKHDYEKNWDKATGFLPLAGEIIIYDADINAPGDLKGTYKVPRIKIGDGIKYINELDFIDDEMSKELNDLNVELNDLISYGTADPDASTSSQFYFKYNS